MNIIHRRSFELTRTELEEAIKQYCGVGPAAELDSFHVKQENLAAPHPVLLMTVIDEEKTDPSIGPEQHKKEDSDG